MNKEQIIDFLIDRLAPEIEYRIKDLTVFRSKLQYLYQAHEELIQLFAFNGNLHDINSDITQVWIINLIQHLVKTSVIYDKADLPK